MKVMRCGFVLIALLATLATSRAEQSRDSTGDYALDLGHVIGAIRAVGFLKDICDEAFPSLRVTNETAYQAWRTKYLAFLQEMERHFSSSSWREAKGDPRRHQALLSETDRHFEQHKAGLRDNLRADGAVAFQKVCMAYPRYILETDRGNLEYFYAEQVATIRRGWK